MELVKGEKQLLAGRRCPRCLSVQWHIRRVKAYQDETGDVFVYSCLGCKRVISLEIKEKEDAHEVLAAS
jgi:hypothetical protein